MTAAELAAWRHLLGLTLAELAHELGVNPRTVRAWESGRYPIPHRITDELAALKARHDLLVADMISAGHVTIPRTPGRGWDVAAAARAMTHGVSIEWRV